LRRATSRDGQRRKDANVRFVQAQFLDSPCLFIRQHHGLADQFRLGFVILPQTSGGVRLARGIASDVSNASERLCMQTLGS